MEDHKIHFTNEPFMAIVQEKGEMPILCTPVVYEEPTNFGVGVFYENGGGSVWGLVKPRNMIAAWRGTEVLRRLGKIEFSTLCNAYYTGLRNPHKSDMKSRIEPMIQKIGRTTYDDIMAMKVPETIIRAILDNQKTEDEMFKPDLYPITDEVRAGTIEWRQEFADAGIKNPETVDAEALAQKKIIAGFEKLLQLYARSEKLDRHCFGMSNVEGVLLSIVEKGTGKTRPDCVLVALAGTVGSLVSAEFVSTLFPNGFSSQKEYDQYMEERKCEAIEHSAQWLATNFKKPRWLFFTSKKRFYILGVESAKQLLTKLLEEYFPTNQSAPAPV